jgi:hypothetical protein
MAKAAEAGAFVSVNHPKPFGPPWQYDDIRAMHAVEVWNGPWAGLNSFALGFWEARLRAGQQLVALGGSDTHLLRSRDPDPRHAQVLGSPTTWVDAGPNPTVRTILDGMRAGRTFVSAWPAGPQLYLERAGRGVDVEVRGGVGATLVVIDDSGSVGAAAVDSVAFSSSFVLPRAAAWVRAQLVASNGELLALTSPLW